MKLHKLSNIWNPSNPKKDNKDKKILNKLTILKINTKQYIKSKKKKDNNTLT